MAASLTGLLVSQRVWKHVVGLDIPSTHEHIYGRNDVDSGSDVVDAHDVARRDGQVRDSRRRRSIALPWCAVSDRAKEVFAG